MATNWGPDSITCNHSRLHKVIMATNWGPDSITCNHSRLHKHDRAHYFTNHSKTRDMSHLKCPGKDPGDARDKACSLTLPVALCGQSSVETDIHNR
ncbi:hypothetical protein RRG08_005494 [Elysia crispata]|uniref:Uncharacterized protein n=1 Tax=Elysia crispata TaxID=231223 RepID=A0AAE0Y0X5_9GAST|nr:hypothetical protein RRG08_005494 [Elysia crispata]